MKQLKKIAQIVSLNKLKKVAIFNHQFPKQKGSKFHLLYQALTQEIIESDADIASLLYENASPKDDRYRQLKSRFKKRLFNTLLLTDIAPNAPANYEKAYVQSTKEWTQVKILEHYDPELACQHARSLLSTALKFRLTDHVVHSSRLLRNYASNSADHKHFEYYQACLEEYLDLLEIELKASNYYHYCLLHLKHPKNTTAELLHQTQSYYSELSALSHRYNSPIFQLYYHKLAIIFFQKSENDAQVIQHCHSLESYFRQYPIYSMPSQLFYIAQQKLLSYLYTHNNDAAQIQIKQYLSVFKQKKQWLALQEKKILIALHSRHYSHAFQDILTIKNHKHYHNISSLEQQKWAIINLYIAYTQIQKYDAPAAKYTFLKQWNLDENLYEQFEYNKEQYHLKLLQCIIQILIALELNDQKTATVLSVQLKQLSTRHHKPLKQFRHIQYCRLLQQLAKAQFVYDQIGSHQKYIDRLESKPFRLDDAKYDLEVIPYPHLWKMTIASCTSVSKLV